MNREIKFRAWDKNKKVMFSEITLEDIADQFDAGYSFLMQDDDRLPNSHNWKKEVDWMQYTGLKDKNGTDIFEGDLLRHYNSRMEVNEGDEAIEVKFGLIQDEISVFGWYGISWWDDDKEGSNLLRCEVIGNIYEQRTNH